MSIAATDFVLKNQVPELMQIIRFFSIEKLRILFRNKLRKKINSEEIKTIKTRVKWANVLPTVILRNLYFQNCKSYI